MQIAEDLLRYGNNDEADGDALRRRAGLAVLALTRALQTATADCLYQLLPRARSMLKLAQKLQRAGMHEAACEWCGVLAWMFKEAEQLRLLCSIGGSAGVGSGHLSSKLSDKVAAGAAAVLTCQVATFGDWDLLASGVAAKRAMGVLASSALGRQAIATTRRNWEAVVDALWDEIEFTFVVEDDGMDMDDEDEHDADVEAAAAYLCSYPVTNILLAAARAAAAVGKEPPCLQHLLRELKLLQDSPSSAEGQDNFIDAVHVQLRWLICQ